MTDGQDIQGIPPHERRIQTICLFILAAFAVGAALSWLQQVLVPFVLAVFFTYMLSPLTTFQMKRLRAPLGVAVIGTLVSALVILGLAALLTYSSVAQLEENVGKYKKQATEFLVKGEAWLRGWAPTVWLDKIGMNATPPEKVSSEKKSHEAGQKAALDDGHEAREKKEPTFALGMLEKLVLGVLQTLQGLLANGLLVLIYVVFLLLAQAARTRERTGTWAQIDAQIKTYLIAKVLVSALTGFLVFVILTILGVDLALVFALFTFLLNFIPNIGSTVACLLPLPVILLDPDLSGLAIGLAIGLPLVVQGVVGNVIEPRMMGKSLDLHPITVLMALILWGQLWGVVGMILSVPITAVLKILFERSELTAPIAHVLAGRLEKDPATPT